MNRRAYLIGLTILLRSSQVTGGRNLYPVLGAKAHHPKSAQECEYPFFMVLGQSGQWFLGTHELASSIIRLETGVLLGPYSTGYS